MARKNHKKRGAIQLAVTIFLSIYLWFQTPSWEKEILKIIASDPKAFSHFGNYWNSIILFLLDNWEIISLLILFESVYAIIENRSLVNDIVNEISRLTRKKN